MSCERPPEGWWCSREEGHEGPCAARPTTTEVDPKGWPLTTVLAIEDRPDGRWLRFECEHWFKAHRARTDIVLGARVGCFECARSDIEAKLDSWRKK